MMEGTDDEGAAARSSPTVEQQVANCTSACLLCFLSAVSRSGWQWMVAALCRCFGGFLNEGLRKANLRVDTLF